jgi:hypothetical protein
MVTMASVLGVRASAMMVDNRYLIGCGWILAPTGPHHRPGGALVRAGDCLGLLLVMTLIVVWWWM